MPQVEVFARPGKMPREIRQTLRGLLPIIVASALNVPEKEDARLHPNDIGVRFRDAGSDDVLTHDVEITVSGNFYRERFESLQETRAPKIRDSVAPHLPSGTKFYVWVFLGQAAFVEAVGTGEAAQA